VILIGGKCLSTISNLMQGALNCLQSWCGGIELSVDGAKDDTIQKEEEFGRISRPKTL
jgi:hypothetical protein